MRFKRPIYRILFFAGWIVVLSGIVVLLIAANKLTSEHLCKGVEIVINDGNSNVYVQQADVLRSMEKTANGSLIKKHFGDINLTQLEKGLRANPWIRNAELYFDTKDVLHVAVSEREPMARVFTTAGTSFYMDSAGYTMPLLDSFSIKLPVVTGFTAAKKWSAKDSAIVKGIKEVVRFVAADPFWNAQIGQIDVTPAGKFELIPVIGSHIIRLGDGENVEDKLKRLFVFYKQVLPKAGLAKYSVLDVRFEGQVVAVKRGPQSPVDSIQLQKNIQELMRKKAAEQEAEGMLPDESLPIAVSTSVSLNKDSVKTITTKKSIVPAPKKTTDQKPVKPTKPNEPKAVMEKRNEY